MRAGGLLAIVLCTVGLFGMVQSSGLPNDAKYFWCSQLYNPYYPLNPTNTSLPLVNRTISYPQPSFRVLPASSLISNSETTTNLLIRANSTACAPQSCSSIFVKATNSDGVFVGQSAIQTDTLVKFSISLASFPKNQTSNVTTTFYTSAGGQILYSEEVTIAIYEYRFSQVSIDYSSYGLKVFDKPWFPVGFYYPWSTKDKFISISVDEMRNNMQAPLPYRPTTPPEDDFLEYMEMASNMRMRVHFDMYTLSQEPNSPEKWYVT